MRCDSLPARDVGARLDRALANAALAAGLEAAVIDHRSRPWASATFTGTRHAVTLLAKRSPTLGGWVAALPDAELPLRGHLVASLAVDGIEDNGHEVWLALTVLTIEEG